MAALWPPPPPSPPSRSLPTEPTSDPTGNADGTLGEPETKPGDGMSFNDDDDDDEDEEDEAKMQHVECHSAPDRCFTARFNSLGAEVDKGRHSGVKCCYIGICR